MGVRRVDVCVCVCRCHPPHSQALVASLETRLRTVTASRSSAQLAFNAVCRQFEELKLAVKVKQVRVCVCV